MRARLLGPLTVVILVAFAVAPVSADEAVILACMVNTPVVGLPEPAIVVACDKTAGVPGICPTSDAHASCAQTLAFFLSLRGYRMVNVQPLAPSAIGMI